MLGANPNPQNNLDSLGNIHMGVFTSKFLVSTYTFKLIGELGFKLNQARIVECMQSTLI